MRPFVISSVILALGLPLSLQAATIPSAQPISLSQPSANPTSPFDTLIFDNDAALNISTSNNLAGSRPWPPAPFDLPTSGSFPGWRLHVNSYSPPRLDFPQIMSVLALCIEWIEVIRRVPARTPISAKTLLFQVKSHDDPHLRMQDVEIALFNSPDEEGAAYTWPDVENVLNKFLDIIRSQRQSPEALARTVIHYAEVVPVHNGVRFRRATIQRKTVAGGRGSA